MAHQNDVSTPVCEQAAQWWALFQDGDPSPAERRDFSEWVVSAPERVQAYLRVARACSALARRDLRWPAVSSDVLIRDALASPEDPVHLPRQQGLPEQAGRRRPTRSVRTTIALAASLLVAVCLGLFALSRPGHFQTKFGEQRSVLLADGSRVTLNTASEIEVRLRADRRSIRLLKGEALFEVAHDPNRPFDVSAGDAVLRAVGTQFNVDRRLERTVVTVVEGRVAILSADAGTEQEPRHPVLSAADRVVIDRNGPGKTEHGVDVSSATAWLNRQIVFSRRTLGEAAEEFNRYNLARIDIRSPALRAEVVTGTFQSNDPASLVSFIAHIPGVRVAGGGSGGYIITFDEEASEQ